MKLILHEDKKVILVNKKLETEQNQLCENNDIAKTL
jgi:hypothetical protein